MKAVTTSRYAAIVGTMALALTAACFAPSIAAAVPDDEAAIRALGDRFAAAATRMGHETQPGSVVSPSTRTSGGRHP